MKVLGRFPSYAVRNADFVTGRRKEGRVVDLQIDVETLPAVGMLVIHEDTVLNMVKKLGWTIAEPGVLEKANKRVSELELELAGMKSTMADIAGYVNA
tara:strand:+ start:2672 stop:2965 length:294 start_codon:yes stop_codon:yes gene_type:complete